MSGGVRPREVRRWWQSAGCIVMMMAIANLQYAWTPFTVPLTKSLGVQACGSWLPVFWTATACDLVAATLAFVVLKPAVMARLAGASAIEERKPAPARVAM